MEEDFTRWKIYSLFMVILGHYVLVSALSRRLHHPFSSRVLPTPEGQTSNWSSCFRTFQVRAQLQL